MKGLDLGAKPPRVNFLLSNHNERNTRLSLRFESGEKSVTS